MSKKVLGDLEKVSLIRRASRFLRRIIRRTLNVPEVHTQGFISEDIARRSFMLRNKMKAIEKQFENIELVVERAEKNNRAISAREMTSIRGYSKMAKKQIGTSSSIVSFLEERGRAVSALQVTGTPKKKFDKLFELKEYPEIERPASPYVMRNRGHIKVLLLNSVGGSMGRLSKALIAHRKVDADCFVASYTPRRQLFYSHEPNANGVFNHAEWAEFLKWAVVHYDIVQSSTLPLHEGIANCYDWLTETIGTRHVWRTTGFIHHYVPREDVLPEEVYQADLSTEKSPNSSRYLGNTFEIRDDHMEIGNNTVFYSSPEKGVYLKGENKLWLPSIRDPELYLHQQGYKLPGKKDAVKVYVPFHKEAVFKGLDKILRILNEIKSEGANIEIVTPENATVFWPDLTDFRKQTDSTQTSIYPIPNHLMPVLLSRVDIVVDQIIMGCYGNTAIEAMMCEKPVIAQKRYDDFKGCPVIDANEDTLKDVVLNLLEDRGSWEKLGKAGRAYVLRKHTSMPVSKIAADTYAKILSNPH